MMIDYISDLHLEINNTLYINHVNDDQADYLILAGDIVPYATIDPARTDSNSRGIRKRFLKLLQVEWAMYKKIFWIPGNHEYYGFYFNDADDEGMTFAKTLDSRLTILNNDCVELNPDNVLIASTLWTDFRRGDPLIMEEVRNTLNDYRQTYLTVDDHRKRNNRFASKNFLTPSAVYEQHQISLHYIQEMNKKYNSKRRVIVTHHAPSYRSISPRFAAHGDSNFGYYSELDHWVSDCGVQVWIHGHTHNTTCYQLGDTKVLGRMHGYNTYERKSNDPITIGRIEI